MVDMPLIDEEEMQMIYNWVDEIPLSRPKRNIARDFSDGGKYLTKDLVLQKGSLFELFLDHTYLDEYIDKLILNSL